MYKLCVISYFKNERNHIVEWILHNKKRGIEHIWLIDNGSNDNYDIKKFIDSKYVTLYKEPNLGQVDSYNKYLPELKKHTEWLAVIDIDEYIYSKKKQDLKEIINEIEKINDYLYKYKNSKELVNQINIQGRLYYPGTFLSPKSVISSNINFIQYDSLKCPKCIHKLSSIDELSIHGFSSGTEYICKYDSDFLCMNHYKFSSYEYLYGIKEYRGGGVSKKKYKRDLKLINNINNVKVVIDDYLKNDSKYIIEYCNQNYVNCDTDLYEESTWNIIKHDHIDMFNKFKSYNNNNKLLNHNQIYEIDNFFYDKQLYRVDTKKGLYPK